ncbi:MAG TPA: CocE/NonD family hydrolase, partial [Flavobacterium sp.]|nr:CocE/NonD family hydrolase [Flavobacterium sp.]
NASPLSDTYEIQFDYYTEMLRFWDFYLKGIDNGIDEEPVCQYYTMGAKKWRSTDTWPLPEQEVNTFYFNADNTLLKDSQYIEAGSITYVIDTTHTTGPSTRWNSLTTIYRSGYTHYPDRREESAKCLSFNLAPFEEDVELTGHPIINLYMSANATDATVFVYIEDVEPDGTVNYVTEGQFRAVHRKVSNSEPPYVQAGPYHTFKREDAMPLIPGKVFNLKFDILPISYRFEKGHKLRVSIAGVDKGHFDRPEDMPTEFEIYFSPDYPSSISLPFVEREEEGEAKN